MPRHRPVNPPSTASASCPPSFQRIRPHCRCLQVALKRIHDVLSSFDHAKVVLREISILRRLSHPNILKLYDAFLRPR